MKKKENKFGVRLPVTGPLASAKNIVEIGLAAERLGFDAVTTHDHVAASKATRYHNSGGQAELVDQREKTGLSVVDVFETMTVLSVLAGKTNKVRLIPCSAVLPWRQPVMFAKQSITLEELSGGRFVCSVVIGNLTADFIAMGVDIHARGATMDEYLEVLSRAFSKEGGKMSYKGKFISFSEIELAPAPQRKIPIWIGGTLTPKVCKRIAKYADGFLGSVDEAGIDLLSKTLSQSGRNIDEIEIGIQTFMCLMKDREEAIRRARYTIESFYRGPEYDNPHPLQKGKTRREVMVQESLDAAFVGSPADLIGKIRKLNEVGITFFDIRQVNQSLDAVLDMMELFAKEVMPSV